MGTIIEGKRLKTVSVTKKLIAAAAYTAGDVLSEATASSTPWTFAEMAKVNGGTGLILKAQALSQTTAITPRLSLQLYKSTPTCVLEDNVSSDAVVHADEAIYLSKIDFPAMQTIGVGGDSETVATPNTVGNLPLAFECASAADDLIGVLVTRDDFTQTASTDMIIKLTTEQF